MKVKRISHIPYSHRVGRYHFQMVQAKLHAPIDPIRSYSLQPFYSREQQWLTALSDSLARLYRYSSDLDQAAREFDPDWKKSAINRYLAGNDPAISAAPDTEPLLEAMRQLVSRFNRLHLFLRDQENVIATHKFDTFERVAEAADGTLQPYGVHLTSDGQLELDEKTWRQAVASRFSEFASAMKGLTKQFREEALRVQNSPLGAFSRWFGDAESHTPYVSLSPSSLRYWHAASTGLFINLLF